MIAKCTGFLPSYEKASTESQPNNKKKRVAKKQAPKN